MRGPPACWPYEPDWWASLRSTPPYTEMTMRLGPLTPEQLAQYERDGSLLVETMFDGDEIGLLLRSAREDRALDAHSYGRDDGEGGRVRLSLWNHPGEGIYGMFARCRRMVDTCEQILGD